MAGSEILMSICIRYICNKPVLYINKTFYLITYITWNTIINTPQIIFLYIYIIHINQNVTSRNVSYMVTGFLLKKQIFMETAKHKM